MSGSVEKKKGIYYGWYIIAALFFATFLAIGSRQGFGVFVKTWEQEWGITTGGDEAGIPIKRTYASYSPCFVNWRRQTSPYVI